MRKGARGNKGVVVNKIKGQILRCDQLFCCLYFSSEGRFSQDGSRKLGLLFNKYAIFYKKVFTMN
jgi:hypothetical protein